MASLYLCACQHSSSSFSLSGWPRLILHVSERPFLGARFLCCMFSKPLSQSYCLLYFIASIPRRPWPALRKAKHPEVHPEVQTKPPAAGACCERHWLCTGHMCPEGLWMRHQQPWPPSTSYIAQLHSRFILNSLWPITDSSRWWLTSHSSVFLSIPLNEKKKKKMYNREVGWTNHSPWCYPEARLMLIFSDGSFAGLGCSSCGVTLRSPRRPRILVSPVTRFLSGSDCIWLLCL